MIQVEELYHTLHRKPFQPFRVHLTDGRVFDIRFHDMNVVGVNFFVIGIPADNGPDPFAEYTIRVPLELIDRVEPLREPVSS